jgi:very-short-patch-repair endonuclease
LLRAEGIELRLTRIAAPARAVADTALTCRMFEPVRALVTAAVQRRLCTPEQLADELEAGPRNGSAFLRRAVADVLLGAESISEAELADLLRGARVPAFELNVPIMNPTGRVVAVADALWRELRAVLEVDSRQHHFYEDGWARTMRRHNLLTATGLAVTHYPPSEIRARPAEVAGEVASWLRGRAAELGVHYRAAAPRAPSAADRAPFRLPPL